MTPREAAVLGRAIRAGGVKPGSHFTYLPAGTVRTPDEAAERFRRRLPAVSTSGVGPTGPSSLGPCVGLPVAPDVHTSGQA